MSMQAELRYYVTVNMIGIYGSLSTARLGSQGTSKSNIVDFAPVAAQGFGVLSRWWHSWWKMLQPL